MQLVLIIKVPYIKNNDGSIVGVIKSFITMVTKISYNKGDYLSYYSDNQNFK